MTSVYYFSFCKSLDFGMMFFYYTNPIFLVNRQTAMAALPSLTVTDLGTGISPSPGSRRRMRHQSSAPARNSNSEASHTALFSRLAAAGVPERENNEKDKETQRERVIDREIE